MRIGSIFIIICMALIAASIGATLHYVAHLPVSECAYISLAILFALMTCEVIASRNRDRTEMASRFEELSRASSDIAREVGTLSRRVAAIETGTNAELKAMTAPLTREIGELAELVENLAESVAVHDALISAPRPHDEAPAASTASNIVRHERSNVAPPVPGPFSGMSAEEIVAIIRDAVHADRIDLYLQPIVTLPQRKVRFYEALSRMRLTDGKLIDAKDFIPHARAAGLIPQIDQRLVLRCVQVVRRLAAKSREAGLFLNIAAETLRDTKVFPELLSYLDANRALSNSLVLEFTQSAFRSLGPSEMINLTLLAERGFPISLDRLDDLKVDPRTLSERGVRFVKVSGELLLRRGGDSANQIHPADLADLLARFGIDLVADRIENEALVVDLLDYDVRYGQGFLFSAPRPIRSEVLQNDLIAERYAAPPPEPIVGASAIAQIARKIG
jgi:cyclic-di-GMP phosphodiesterase TipF (flagellum assembly factor)